MQIDLENGTAVFSINIVGNVERQTYLGTFKVKCVLSPYDFIKADRLYRELLGGTTPEVVHAHARSCAFAFSQLKFRIIECPPFWENPELGGSHLKDDNVIIILIYMNISNIVLLGIR